MKNLLFLFGALLLLIPLSAQESVYRTFKDTRVINSHSVETLPKRKLDFRVVHRFGDVAGDQGGYATLFGLEAASDILIGFEYGITDRLMVGIARSKGAGAMPGGTPGLRQNLNAVGKYRLIRQSTEGGSPVSVTLLGLTTMSTAQKVENPDVIQNFASFSHRFAYMAQLIIGAKYSEAVSLQLMPAYTYRNIVPFEDVNGIFSIGAAGKVQLTKVFGLIADFTFPFGGNRNGANGFYPALGLGLEIDTGGHAFQINVTNARSIVETDFIPYTTSNWLDGEFRLGFTISRMFNL